MVSATSASPAPGVHGDSYVLSADDVARFRRDGFVVLRGVLTDDELARHVDPVYDRFMRGEIAVPGKDLCDMSGAIGRARDEFSIYNVMLPRKYEPAWQDNLYERRAASIVQQLYGDGMTLDYDQLLAKKPHSADAKFPWHQDMAYWPDLGTDSATATCWLAVSRATAQNGCMSFVPGSHAARVVNPHRGVASSREESHVLTMDYDDSGGKSVRAELSRGDMTVHNEYVIHASSPNVTDEWRKAYIVAFRRSETVARERALGFTHSHNDAVNWDSFKEHGAQSSVVAA